MTDKKKRWERVNALLEKALMLPPAEQRAWLQSECDDDTDLLEEVVSLLDYDAEKTGGIRASVQSVAADLGNSDENTYIGKRVGNYRITSKLAEGGMGKVFLADHAGGDFERRVAVKILPRHHLDTDAARRFVEERRILAGLNHPNIATLIDGGTFADGIPYIVMDYIEGLTIDAHCKAAKLGNAAMIDLIRKVCSAIEYAHRKLVIHRDIKPSNIIVDKRGEPMLLDFGIAKLLQPNADNAHETREEQRILTPMYASPEQIEGLPITTAADVYGIGLLLYRLLTGQMPYAATATTPRELERAILDQTPEKPSAIVTQFGDSKSSARWAQRQRRALRGELDTILLTALRKTPERRYPSVAAFANDLERYRSGRPIFARRDSPLYVLRKFVSRNRWPVALTGATLVGVVAMATYYTNELKVERDTAEQTAAFLSDIFAATDPYQKNRDGLTVEALLDSGLDKLENDDTLEPLVRARLLTTIALVQRNLGDNDRAEVLAAEALSLVESYAGLNDAALLPPLSVMARVRTRAGDYESANAYAERMLRIAEAERGEFSRETAQATHLLSVQAYRGGDLDAMGEWAEKTYAIRKAVYDENDMAIATGANSLALYHWQTGGLAEARDFYAESARIQEQQPERNDLQYASLLHNLALLHNDTGEYETAADTYEESVRIRRAAAADDPILPLTLYALAHTRTRLGQHDAAHPTFLETIPRQAAVAGRDKHLVAYALNGFGMMLEEVGDLTNSAVVLGEANRIFDAEFDEPHQDQTSTWIGLARLASHRKDFAEGRRLVDRAIALRTETEGANDLGTLRAHNALGRLLFDSGNPGEAASLLEPLLERYASADSAEHPFAVEARTWLGRAMRGNGQLDDGIAQLREALRLGEAVYKADHVENVQRRLWLAEMLIESGEQEEGASMLQAAQAELASIKLRWDTALQNYPVPSLELLFELPET